MGASNPHTICAEPLRRAGPSILAPGVPPWPLCAERKEQKANKEQTKNTVLCRLLMIARALSDKVAIRRGAADRFA
jgi:hypothetical protein